MSFGITSVVVDDCRAMNGPRVGRRRRNAMANIFSGIDRAVLERNGWGSYGNDNSDSDLAETEETAGQDGDIPNSPSEQSENVEISLSRTLELTDLNNTREGSDIELERILDVPPKSSFCERRVERSVSITSVYQLWEQMEHSRRRNASPHVLDTISNSQLRVLKDMFVSTVHGNRNKPGTWLLCN